MDVETQFNVTTLEGVPVVLITGDLDQYSTPRFRSVVSELVEKGLKNLVVDMSEVRFLDSGGMSGLIFAIKCLSAMGGRLSLANCNPRIARKLDIGGLTKMPDVLALCTSLEQALQDSRKP